MKKLPIGTTVRFNNEHGSWGVVEGPRHYDDGYYVRWNYGLDMRGEAITALSSVAAYDVIKIDRRVYKKSIQCRAFSPEIKAIKDEYLGRGA